MIFEIVADGVGCNGRVEIWNGTKWVCGRAGLDGYFHFDVSMIFRGLDMVVMFCRLVK